MDNLNFSLKILIMVTLFVSFFYLLVFIKTKEKYIIYWGQSWIFYSLSLIVLLFLFSNLDSNLLISLRKFLDLFNMLFLLMGVYSFMNLPVPSHWIKFAMLSLLWVCISLIYALDLVYIIIPLSIYQSALAFVICFLIVKHWQIGVIEKILGLLVFSLWGFSKAYFPYYQVQYLYSNSHFIYEIILSNILNFFILLMYVHKIKRDLSLKENHFSSILENAKDIVFHYNFLPTKHFSYISPSVKDIVGYSQDEFYKHNSIFEEISSPDHRGKFSFLKEPFHFSTFETLLTQVIHKNGEIIWLEFHNSFYKDIKGNITAIDGIIRDVSIKIKSEEAALKLKKERQLLLSYISHELKTPVTSILGYIMAIHDGTISDHEEKESALQLIYSKTCTLQRLIDDLFQLSKLETNQFSFHFMQMSAEELICPIIEKYKADIANANIIFSTNITKNSTLNSIDVISDAERINQVLSNLVNNAINHTPENGEMEINCHENHSTKEIIISVKDSGYGIRPEDASRVFDRFYKGNNPYKRSKKSNGLGLAISKEIVTSHNGKIWVESKLKEGTVFSFTLPIYEETEYI